MIFRCTDQFLRSFDALPADVQHQVIEVVLQFRNSPRLPSREARKVKHTEHIWHLPVGSSHELTYHFLSSEDAERDICVFRNVLPTEPD